MEKFLSLQYVALFMKTVMFYESMLFLGLSWRAKFGVIKNWASDTDILIAHKMNREYTIIPEHHLIRTRTSTRTSN